DVVSTVCAVSPMYPDPTLFRPASPGEEPLFPPSQGQYFWVKALCRQGHDWAVFWRCESALPWARTRQLRMTQRMTPARAISALRSEEHTTELQSRENLVCRLLL